MSETPSMMPSEIARLQVTAEKLKLDLASALPAAIYERTMRFLRLTLSSHADVREAVLDVIGHEL